MLVNRPCSQPAFSNVKIKVRNVNTRATCEISLKLTISTPERSHWRRTDWCLYCQLCTVFTYCSVVSIGHFEQVNASWVVNWLRSGTFWLKLNATLMYWQSCILFDVFLNLKNSAFDFRKGIHRWWLSIWPSH